jgi:hypothetical protein
MICETQKMLQIGPRYVKQGKNGLCTVHRQPFMAMNERGKANE